MAQLQVPYLTRATLVQGELAERISGVIRELNSSLLSLPPLIMQSGLLFRGWNGVMTVEREMPCCNSKNDLHIAILGPTVKGAKLVCDRG